MEQLEIKAKIAELRGRYARLTYVCRYGTRVSRETARGYPQEIESLQAQLNSITA